MGNRETRKNFPLCLCNYFKIQTNLYVILPQPVQIKDAQRVFIYLKDLCTFPDTESSAQYSNLKHKNIVE